MGDMGFPRFIVDQYVIKKDKGEMTQKGLKYFVHKSLEGRRCTAKAKGHHQELKFNGNKMQS